VLCIYIILYIYAFFPLPPTTPRHKFWKIRRRTTATHDPRARFIYNNRTGMQYYTHYCCVMCLPTAYNNMRIKVPRRYTSAIKRNFCGVIRRRIYKYDGPRPHKFVDDPCRTDTRFKLYTHYVCCIPRVHARMQIYNPKCLCLRLRGERDTRRRPSEDINSCRLIRV